MHNSRTRHWPLFTFLFLMFVMFYILMKSAYEVIPTNQLKLKMTEQGQVNGIINFGQKLPADNRYGGFYIRGVGGTQNILQNPSFEEDKDQNGIPDGWRIVGSGSLPTLDKGSSHHKNQSIVIHNQSEGKSKRLVADLEATPNTYYYLRKL